MAKVRPISSRSSELPIAKEELINDFGIVFQSRHISLIGRKEVLSGKAKFGIFGDGKELPCLAMARAFKPGDWRSGYYRDQTFALAVGLATTQQLFAQLYADTDLEREPMSGGRQMNNHFASRYIAADGSWLEQTSTYNCSSDISPTAGQMPRLVGLGYASKLYRNNPDLADLAQFSRNGEEIAFGTIGNASTSEGLFYESFNAMGVLEVPAVMSVWDDGYGISVTNRYQMVKESISDALAGFARKGSSNGYKIHKVAGWDYLALRKAYDQAAKDARKSHIPALMHIVELCQPQGHSTSGSHERYKDEDRLSYEQSIDGVARMRQWLLDNDVITEAELAAKEEQWLADVQSAQKRAWQEFHEPLVAKKDQLMAVYDGIGGDAATAFKGELARLPVVNIRAVLSNARKALRSGLGLADGGAALQEFVRETTATFHEVYTSHLHQEEGKTLAQVSPEAKVYSDKPERMDGRLIIRAGFDSILERDPRVFIIGEDIGMGGVNLEFEGLQDKFGELRITDTGIREATILGQGIGAAMRGLRPIVDIQYLDYLLYAFQTMSDDLATLHYRTRGGQSAPVIVRTKGHRLEGIWHTGSPMGVILGGSRGIQVCTPRNMVQAVGMYNTLLESDQPALVIEVLNSYRMKEQVPDNLTTYKQPLGVVEVLREGEDATLVTYGACCQVAMAAADALAELGVSVEVIDAQTLLPFDEGHRIVESIAKTGTAAFLDEDVSGGATAFMLKKVLEDQRAYDYLDSQPITITAADNRSAYGSDGDYFCKPNSDDVVDRIYAQMHERDPQRFPALY